MNCAFNLQDTLDREDMYLLGLREEAPKESPQQSPSKPKVQGSKSPRRGKTSKIVRVEERCLSCSGQAPTVLSAFKMACLQYNPSPVKFQDVDHTRIDLLAKMEQVLNRA